MKWLVKSGAIIIIFTFLPLINMVINNGCGTLALTWLLGPIATWTIVLQTFAQCSKCSSQMVSFLKWSSGLRTQKKKKNCESCNGQVRNTQTLFVFIPFFLTLTHRLPFLLKFTLYLCVCVCVDANASPSIRYSFDIQQDTWCKVVARISSSCCSLFSVVERCSRSDSLNLFCLYFIRRIVEIDHDGLVVIMHPWESGLDASPLYDPAHGIKKPNPSFLEVFRVWQHPYLFILCE